MAYIETRTARFAEHGFTVVSVQLAPGKKLGNTTSLTISHSCGYARKYGITLQKAQKSNFKVCPICHDREERTYIWSRDKLAQRIKVALGATLIEPDASAVFARKSTDQSIRTTATLRCDTCGTTRMPRVQTLLRVKGDEGR